MRFALVVRYPESERGDIQTIGNTFISLPSGGTVPLSQVARIVAEEGPVQVSREFGQRRIVIECNVRGRDIGSFVEEAKRGIEQSVALAEGDAIGPEHVFINSPRPSASERPATLEEVVAAAERRAIEVALARHEGSLDSVAHDLGLSATTLWRKMKRHGISRSRFNQGGRRPHSDG